MGTYWQNFVNEYEKEIPFISISKTLEAFWHFSNGGLDVASELMGRK